MSEALSSKKRLAINTIILYIRMVVVMVISFYATRVVLKALGVIDFGLVNAIGGVVSMFSFVATTLSTACSRYFSFELGKKDYARLNQLFSLILVLFVCVSVFLLASTETIGLWYLNNKLVLPSERVNAAFWFFQLTIGTIIVGWLAIPYTSLAVSYENLALYSWLSIFDAVIKLFVALAIPLADNCDRLVFYGILLFVGTVLHSGIYFIVVRVRYPVCRYKWYFEKKTLKEVCGFGGWHFLGVFAWMTSDALVNLLLNLFFGPVVNAARGVAMQVNSGVYVFTHNFLTAARPQLVKLWADNQTHAAWALYKSVSKGSYFLVFVFALPLCLELPFVLSRWLGEVPEHTVVFTRLIIITSVLNTFSHPTAYLVQAVGRMALFEGVGSGVRLFIFPVSYVFLRKGCPPESVFYVTLAFTVICVCIRLGVLFKVAKLSAKDFALDVALRLFVVSLLSIGFSLFIESIMIAGWIRFVVCCISSGVVSSVVFFSVALNAQEKMSAFNAAKKVKGKLFHFS